jgi:hypothetical protein
MINSRHRNQPKSQMVFLEMASKVLYLHKIGLEKRGSIKNNDFEIDIKKSPTNNKQLMIGLSLKLTNLSLWVAKT